MNEQHFCVGKVKNKSSYFGHYRCSRKATVERDGKHYCTQHDPEKVKERAAASRLAYDAKFAVQNAHAHAQRKAIKRRIADAVLAGQDPANLVSEYRAYEFAGNENEK